MSCRSTDLAKVVIHELQSKNGKDFIERITSFLEELENKIDPEPSEIKMVEEVYNFLEKFKLLEGHLELYISENLLSVNEGSKLSELYSTRQSYGTSKMFD